MITLTNNQNEQLFTELTPQEASVVEGGFRIRLGRLTASSLTYDDRNNRPVADEPRLYNNGRKVWDWRTKKKGLQVGGKGLWLGGKVINISSLKDLYFVDYDRGPANDDYVRFRTVNFENNYMIFRGVGASYKLRFSRA